MILELVTLLRYQDNENITQPEHRLVRFKPRRILKRRSCLLLARKTFRKNLHQKING
jgi:hypothetical protein